MYYKIQLLDKLNKVTNNFLECTFKTRPINNIVKQLLEIKLNLNYWGQNLTTATQRKENNN